MEQLSWLFGVLGVLGAYLNAKKYLLASYWLWLIALCGLLSYNMGLGLWSQSTLLGIFLVIVLNYLGNYSPTFKKLKKLLYALFKKWYQKIKHWWEGL